MPPTARDTPPAPAEQSAQSTGISTATMNRALLRSYHMAELANTMGTEVLRFASRRLRAQAEYFDALARCGSVQDVPDRQMESSCAAPAANTPRSWAR